jgi:hypothetical protein
MLPRFVGSNYPIRESVVGSYAAANSGGRNQLHWYCLCDRPQTLLRRHAIVNNNFPNPSSDQVVDGL